MLDISDENLAVLLLISIKINEKSPCPLEISQEILVLRNAVFFF